MNTKDLDQPGEIEMDFGIEIYDESYEITVYSNESIAHVLINGQGMSIGDMLCMIQGLQRAIEILKEREEKYNANNS